MLNLRHTNLIINIKYDFREDIYFLIVQFFTIQPQGRKKELTLMDSEKCL